MYRSFVFIGLFFVSVFCFAQQNLDIRVIGKIPNAANKSLYQIQVGAFKIVLNAEKAFERLKRNSLNPSYEKHLDFTRVLIKGINAADVPAYIEKIRRAGFSEVIVKVDPDKAPVVQRPASTPAVQTPASTPAAQAPVSTATVQTPSSTPAAQTPVSTATVQTPVSTAAIPSAAMKEIAYRSVKVGETKSLADLVAGKNIVSWTSSTPSVVSVDTNGNITGLKIGNGFININETEYISVVVVPSEPFFVLPESQETALPQNTKAKEGSIGITEYKTEPTFRLAYRFNNKGENKGASGSNGGIDILGRGSDYEWLWTTYYQGGWFYDLNGVQREMINGYQKDAHNGIELIVKPEFVYDNGVPYLQLRHILHNPNNTIITGQKFCASADVMMHHNDSASLLHKAYGAYMADSEVNPALELMFVCESRPGINPVTTLWLGEFDSGTHLEHVYEDDRSDVQYLDSAIGFSYQNITLTAKEVKEFIVRFTLVRTEN